MNMQSQKSHEVWTEERLRTQYAESEDVRIRSFDFGEKADTRVILAYADGLCDDIEIDKIVIPKLAEHYDKQGNFLQPLTPLTTILPIQSFENGSSPDKVDEILFEGSLIFLFVKEEALYSLGLSNRPQRQPNDSNTEISIKGPRDCFVEDIVVNIALVRKRIRSRSLHVEYHTLGVRTRTKVGLLYMYDIISPKLLNELRKRLDSIHLDGIYSINQLEEMLVGSKFKILPLLDFTGRPDYIVSSLLAGRFVLIVDGIPMVLSGPAGLTYIMKSPEDVHFNYVYISFSRIIRIFSLFISIFLPGIWVSLVAFHPDQIPFRMMATIAISRLGLPLSSQMEMFILLMLLEIFREAGVRLPSSIGQTLTSIGALIIGDAAIRAGLVSPSVVVVGAVTAVSSVTLVNQTLSTMVSILRLIFFFLASFLGMYGLILGVIIMIAYMSSLRSFGVNYLAPLSPLRLHEVASSFLRVPWTLLKKRPKSLNTIDRDREGEEGQ
ncbi:spore germination protein [Paenibacillus nasutitermitis]|uniref:Spore germination protein KA n=1 Tax=Paenibacillus nasutitermitis TaxID=1652958 RepID=A0A916YSC7_9BACL|nr:spore germination protein [Paenibacillus nasutitermitis]GGD58538.1 spore germination protein KA [Paenibacillus nasutitermitis]